MQPSFLITVPRRTSDHYYAISYRHNLAIGPANDIHHFVWLNQRRPGLKKGSDAYFIYPSNYYGSPKSSLKNDFALVEDSQHSAIRSGNPVRYFVVYRMHDFKGQPGMGCPWPTDAAPFPS
jgi:hypothetical protein